MEHVRTAVVGKTLRKGLGFTSSFPFHFKKGQGPNGLMKSYGESAQPLQSVKSKYLAVSPVTDESEQLDEDVNGRSHHSNFYKLKF